jgi:hypothetical protein
LATFRALTYRCLQKELSFKRSSLLLFPLHKYSLFPWRSESMLILCEKTPKAAMYDEKANLQLKNTSSYTSQRLAENWHGAPAFMTTSHLLSFTFDENNTIRSFLRAQDCNVHKSFARGRENKQSYKETGKGRAKLPHTHARALHTKRAISMVECTVHKFELICQPLLSNSDPWLGAPGRIKEAFDFTSRCLITSRSIHLFHLLHEVWHFKNKQK